MVMAITLIALVLLLIGIVATLRSVDTSSILIGNLAFRRDLTNRAENAIVSARAAFVSGGLQTEALRSADQAGSNYSSFKLPSPAGIPTVLISDSAYEALYGPPTPSSAGITLRWVIDRQCLAAGAFSTASCEYTASSSDAGGSSWLHKPGGASRPVYRISVRVSGPRNTEAYFQTSYVD
jgi:hypothetical protein